MNFSLLLVVTLIRQAPGTPTELGEVSILAECHELTCDAQRDQIVGTGHKLFCYLAADFSLIQIGVK